MRCDARRCGANVRFFFPAWSGNVEREITEIRKKTLHDPHVFANMFQKIWFMRRYRLYFLPNM